MIPLPDFNLQRMSRKGLQLTLDWAAREGWQPGVYDAEAFYAADPDGFFQAVTSGGKSDGSDDVENMIGAISAVAYGTEFGFIGLFIVDPSFRGHRIGNELAVTALDRLASQRVVGLDGVLRKAPQYKSIYGFEFAWTNIRHEWRPSPGASSSILPPDKAPDLEFVPITESNFAEAERLDRQYFLAPRTAFLQHWLYPCTRVGGQALLCRQGGEAAGYGVLRACVSGYKIGPLFAGNGAVAEALFHRLSANLPADSLVWMDIPDVNTEAMAFAKSQGMEEKFRTARMYKGGEWPLSAQNIWGVTSLELG